MSEHAARVRPVEICDTFHRADRYRYEVDRRLPAAEAKGRRAAMSKGAGWIRP